ncbi:MAG: acetyl/propionyl/methylcrotonyl-CoA carboxylase subunit alpha [Pseudomonadota bacterium]|nr:acetyl/propionyl/methylcrotonyl-CoA carboxylase subunit alpha [Pseudomonadota bacterium]
MFDKLLIANRGEIACRVIRSAKRMGIQTVAVFSDADRDAPHVQMADEAVHIGASPSAESYLLVDRIIEACRSTGAEAVHPGYGFLSEKSALVLGLEKAGIAFVGPPAKAIEVMGDKIASKALAESAGVPTIPGFNEVLVDAQDAVSRAGQIGYPVMLKASAGGGGKGMRVAWNDEECREGFERASSEARSSFSDDRVFIEKFVSQPRHIEIQVLADHHGNAIHLNERECSIQRRHQKVVEEAPSPFVDEALRTEMGAQALALARAVGYTSAGTVEFIVDAERNFYFLEMNTRLQVEHPVTELITGVDLVEWMLRIAAGEELTLTQQDIGIRGWALESRVYAEDPYRGFLPSSGRVHRFRPPDDAKGVRVDTGICEGGEVSLHYDPMIAKLVTHGPDREEAAQTMSRVLDRFEIRGIQSNIPFLAALVQHPRFLAGETTTGFIEEEFPEGFSGNALSQDIIRRIVALVAVVHEHWHLREDADAAIPQTQSADRVVQINADQYAVSVVTDQDGWQATVEGETVSIRFSSSAFTSVIDFYADGVEVTAQLSRTGARYEVFHSGASVDALVLEPYSAALYHLMPRKVVPDLSHLTLSPMPGLLVSVAVTEGTEVKAGDELAVIEAMKMENVIRAERDGKVLCVHAEPGEALEVDQQIIEFVRESSA